MKQIHVCMCVGVFKCVYVHVYMCVCEGTQMSCVSLNEGAEMCVNHSTG